MKSKVSEKDVLQLFSSLKNAENNYPHDMIESRRDTFSKQAAAMAILAKASGEAVVATTTSQTASTTSSGAADAGSVSMSTILETALVIAIVAEAGVAAYVYREKIAEFVNSTFGPKTEQVASPPEDTSSDSTVIAVPSDETPTATVTETPTPPEFVNPGTIDNDNNGDSKVTSTPDPNDDPGNRYGNTPKPERTKENNKDKDNNQNK